jgi:VCBS repeat-containing protein
MAAASSHQPRRTKGRHRKPSNFEPSTYAHWLGVGAVGLGLATSVASATGVASADDSSATKSSPNAPGHGTAATNKPVGANHSKVKSTRLTTAGSTHTTNTTDDASTGSSTATPHTPSTKSHRRKQTQTDPAPLAHPALPHATHSRQHPDAAATSSAPTPPTPAVTATAPTNVVATPAPSAATDAAATSSADDAQTKPKPTGFQAVIDDVLKTIGLGSSGKLGSTPIGPVEAVVPAMWLAVRQHHDTQISKPAATTTTLSESEREAAFNESLGQDLREFTHAVQHGDLAGIRNMALDFIGLVPVVGAPLAGKLDDLAKSTFAAAVPAAAVSTDAVSAAAVPAAAVTTDNSAFLALLQWAVNRLGGVSSWIWHQTPWPGTPRQFVTVANNQIDQSLDTADDQLDALIASPGVGTPAQVVSGFVDILHFWLAPAIPNYSFSDTLNAMGDFLNRVVPTFNISDGAGTLSVISVYKIMGAAVAGTATALSDMLNGVYDPQQIEIDVIYSTTGATVTRSDLTNSTSLETKIAASVALGGGIYSHPENLLSTIALPTWTAAQVNPITIVAYIALVGLYDRFQSISNFAAFTTNTTYESYIYTLGSGSSESEYAAGTFTAVDQDGRTVSFQPADGNTYTSAWGALVTVNTYGGGYTYTNTLPGAAFFHAGAAGQSDTVQIPVYSADGAPYTLTFQIKIIGTANSAPTVSNSVGSGDALGVVRGTVSGSDSDGDTLIYSLVSSSVTGLSGTSAYTTNGGIVTLNSSTGAFTYASTSTGGSSASFQVQVNDGHGGLTTTTVTVPNTTSITPANVNTSTQGVVTGSLPAPIADAGMFTSYVLGTDPTNGTVTFNPSTGAFTYTRTAAGHTAPASDSFTVIATDTSGRTVTLTVPVQPTVADTAPTLTLTTAPTVGTLSGSTVDTGSATSTQTSTGKFTTTDADGDTVTFSATTGSQGGTLTFNSDGSFSYTGTLSNKTRHAAAKIGATSAQMNDTFTVTASDGYGGTTTDTLNVPIYAINSAPTVNSWTVTHILGTIGAAVSVSDADGDLTSTSKPHNGNANDGNPWYTFSRSTSTFDWYGSGGVQDFTASGTGSITFTVGDGYYVVTNGVVTSTPATGSITG